MGTEPATATPEQQEAALLRWYADPVAYFREVLGVTTLWDRQIEVLESVRDYRETWVPAGHSVSKDYTAGRIVCWWVTTRKGIAITTANTREQVRDVLWGELREARAGARVPLGGDLKPVDCKWDFAPKWYALGLTARETNAFQGKHAGEVLVVGDEAGGLPQWVFLALASCATGEHDRQLYLGNLTCGPEHDFAKAVRGDPCIPGVKRVVRIPSTDSPNVKAGRTVIPGLCTQAYIDDIARRFGKDSPIYAVRVGAKDPSTATTSLIGYQHVAAAANRRMALPEDWRPRVDTPIRLGVDVARFGKHRSTVWMVQGPHAERLDTLSKWDGTAIAQRLAYHVKSLKYVVSVAIDVSGGLGAGPADALRDLVRRDECPDVDVIDVNFGAGPSTELENEVGNKRSELYWRLRDWLWLEGAVTFEEPVIEEVIAPTYRMNGKPSRLYLEPKEDLEERLGRSPDDADGLALAVAGHVGSGGTIDWNPPEKARKPIPPEEQRPSDPRPGTGGWGRPRVGDFVPRPR